MESIWDDISAGESRTLEFKEDFPKDSLKYVKTAVAFSNCQGGRIVFGVREDGVVVGIENPEMVADQAVDTISNMCTPEMSLTTYIETRDGRSIVVVNVPAGLGRPYHVKSKGKRNGTYVRVGAMTRIADDDWLMDLTLEGVRRSFDAERYVVKRVESGSEGILELCRYLSSRNDEQYDEMRLVNMGLLIPEGDGYIPSRAFMMLTDNPFPNATVRCARFRGKDRLHFLDSKDYGGTLVSQIEQAVSFVLNYLPRSSEIKGLYRRDGYEIPAEAVREIVVNAVMHRSYVPDSEIRVALYDDRLEVESPGGLPFGFTEGEVLSGRAKSRNPVIARFLKEAGLVEGWGSGMIRILESCRAAGLPDPCLKDEGNAVRFTVFRTHGSGELGLDGNDAAMLSMMEDDPDVNVSELTEMLGVSRATVNRMISRAKEAGVLSREGSKKTGRWVVSGVGIRGGGRR